MESIDLSISIVIVLMSVLLYFISYAAEKYITRKWCLLYFVPSIAVIAATAFSGFDIYMLPVYSGALLLLAGYIKTAAGSEGRYVYFQLCLLWQLFLYVRMQRVIENMTM